MLICVTGPMAAGKNLASDILEQMGFAAVDADVLVHSVIETEEVKNKIIETYSDIAQKLGLSLLNLDGTICRKAVGQIIFANPELMAKQESIIYPALIGILDDFMEQNKNKDALINATVLYKVDTISKMDFVLYVDAPMIVRFFRARKRDGMTVCHILERFKSQKNLFSKYKKSNADIRKVWNIGTRKQLERKLCKILSR